jgi:hypothetical protein
MGEGAHMYFRAFGRLRRRFFCVSDVSALSAQFINAFSSVLRALCAYSFVFYTYVRRRRRKGKDMRGERGEGERPATKAI